MASATAREYHLRYYFAAVANDPRPEAMDSTSLAELIRLERVVGPAYLLRFMHTLVTLGVPSGVQEAALRQIARLGDPTVESPMQRARVAAMVNVIRFAGPSRSRLARVAQDCLVRMRDASALDMLTAARNAAPGGSPEQDRCADAVVMLQGADLIRRVRVSKSLKDRLLGWLSASPE